MRDAEWNINAQEINLSPNSKALFLENDISLNSVDVWTINSKQSVQLDRLLKEYNDDFNPNGKPTSETEHYIHIVDHPPISMPPYRLSPPRKEILKSELGNMLKEKIIEPCNSLWAAPVVMVPKPNGTLRLCVDYRRLKRTRSQGSKICSMKRIQLHICRHWI